MKDDLLNSLKMKHLAAMAGPEETALQKRLRIADRAMPPAVLDNVTKQLLEAMPAAEKKYGVNHPNYLFYIDLLLVCIWCSRYIGITEDLQLRHANLKLENTIIREQLLQAEKELQRYSTVEDLVMNGSIDWYMRTVLDRIGEAAPNHPRVQAFMSAMEILYPTPAQP
jgi:hypothetical protein